MSLLEQLQSFTALEDGGYYSIVESTSELEMVLEDGRRENLFLKSITPTEFTMRAPEVESDGSTRLDIEILNFQVEGLSQVLWPGQKVTMSGGRRAIAEALPIYGTTRIPAGQSLEDGAYSEQLVYVEVNCPEGRFHNVEPVRMAAVIDCIPPNHRFNSVEENTVLYDSKGLTKFYLTACGSATTG